MNGSIQPRAVPPSGIKNKPFKASWECALGAPRCEVYAGTLYRDSAGRVRFEVHSPNGEEMIFIKDQDRRELNILQPSTREVIRESVGNGPKGWAYSSVLPCYTEEYKVIQGIRCRRVALKDVETRADVGDTWISDEYFLVMIDTGKAAEVLHDWRVVEIDLGEPAAELFVAPRDYSVVPEGTE
jgi:hypothetical protein